MQIQTEGKSVNEALTVKRLESNFDNSKLERVNNAKQNSNILQFLQLTKQRLTALPGNIMYFLKLVLQRP